MTNSEFTVVVDFLAEEGICVVSDLMNDLLIAFNIYDAK